MNVMKLERVFASPVLLYCPKNGLGLAGFEYGAEDFKA
jgi:hypothetical protein